MLTYLSLASASRTLWLMHLSLGLGVVLAVAGTPATEADARLPLVELEPAGKDASGLSLETEDLMEDSCAVSLLQVAAMRTGKPEQRVEPDQAAAAAALPAPLFAGPIDPAQSLLLAVARHGSFVVQEAHLWSLLQFLVTVVLLILLLQCVHIPRFPRVADCKADNIPKVAEAALPYAGAGARCTSSPVPSQTRDHFKGLALAAAGMLVFSLDSLFFRLALAQQPGPGCVIFYKYAMLAMSLLSSLVFVAGGPGRAISMLFKWDRRAVAASLFQAAAGIFFLLALQSTSAANVLVTMGTGPLWALFLGWLCLKERLSFWTTVITISAFAFIVVIFLGSMNEDTRSAGRDVRGDFLGLLAGLCYACWLLAQRRNSTADQKQCFQVSGLLGAALSAAFGVAMAQGHVDPGVGGACQIHSGFQGWAYVILNGAVTTPLGYYAASRAVRYLPAGEVALVFLGEPVLGIVWVYLLLGEVPKQLTMIGATGVLSCLIAHALHGMRRQSEAGEADGDCRAQGPSPLSEVRSGLKSYYRRQQLTQ